MASSLSTAASHTIVPTTTTAVASSVMSGNNTNNTEAVVGGGPSTSATTSTNYFIDVENDRYPFCIVWTPIPLITWLLPFVGHMGICDSYGVCHDFAGPYFISRDNLAFGRPCKYWCLHPSQLEALDGLMGNTEQSVTAKVEMLPSSSASSSHHDGRQSKDQAPLSKFTAADMWDAGVYRAADQYRKQMYNFFCNNCHSYVATALEQGEAIAKCNPTTASSSSTAGSSSGAAVPSTTTTVQNGASLRTASKGSVSPNPNTNSYQQLGNSNTTTVRPLKLKSWNMVTLAAQVFLFGKYVSFGRFLQAHLPFFIIVGLVVGFTYMGKAL